MAALARCFACLFLSTTFALGCAQGSTGGDDALDGSAPLDAKGESSIPDGAVGCGNTQTNPQNCGSCGNVCPSGSTCNAGKCACAKGEVCKGACVDTQTDATNCGGCGKPCTGGPPNTTWSCVAGTCTMGCSGAQTACNGVCVDTLSDKANCGSCGNACGGAEQCCGGGCVNTTKDNANCGTCGIACLGGQTCNSSSCTACDGPAIGSCSHNACNTGSSLSIGCDGISFCVTAVCAKDPVCCLLSWSSKCVADVQSECGYTCNGC